MASLSCQTQLVTQQSELRTNLKYGMQKESTNHYGTGPIPYCSEDPVLLVLCRSVVLPPLIFPPLFYSVCATRRSGHLTSATHEHSAGLVFGNP